jgi:hypothetical protein
VLIKGTFTTSAGVLTDPTNASVDVVTPSGITTTYTYLALQVQKASTGVYSLTIDTTGKSGRWTYRWWSPLPLAAANAADFIVDPFPPQEI